MSTLKSKALALHKENQGKIELKSKVSVKTNEDLTMAYTPGVAEPCIEINKDYKKIYEYTSKGNWVAIVTNGTAVLGLGDIGAGAGLPVMEGKAVLFKTFAGVDAFPICLNSKNIDEIVNAVKLMEPSFGGINLEDIKAPECFKIEERLKKEMNIPVFHDDQHGTAIVVLSALINSLKFVNKKIDEIKLVVNGAGSAGIAITKLLISAGLKNVIMVDRAGILCTGESWMNDIQKDMAEITNKEKVTGSLVDALKESDVFIGVSAPGALTKDMINVMNKDAIVFAMANPTPEILPNEAHEAGALIVGTGRSDFPNQVNNVLAFPGIFRGALDVQAKEINEEMKLAAAYAIAELIPENEIRADYVIVEAFDLRIAPKVAEYVAKAAIETGIAQRTDITPEMVREHTKKLLGI
ncbi:NAD(P)-dependent malic enzyme [Clostridium tertium]